MRRDFIQVILKCEQLKAGQWVGNVGVRGGMREMRVIRKATTRDRDSSISVTGGRKQNTIINFISSTLEKSKIILSL